MYMVFQKEGEFYRLQTDLRIRIIAFMSGFGSSTFALRKDHHFQISEVPDNYINSNSIESFE